MLLFALLLFNPSDTCIESSNQYAMYFDTKIIHRKEKKSSPINSIKNSSDTTVTYSLFNKKGLNIDLCRHLTSLKNDFFIINGKKYEFLKSASKSNRKILIDKEIGVFNIETSSSFVLETLKGRKYFIFKGSVQGAAGSMSSLQLFFVVDFTSINNIKLYHLQNWATDDYSFFDFNNDGYLDFSFFKDLTNPKNVVIKNYSLFDFKPLVIKKKSKWKGFWKKSCLQINA